MAQGNLLDLTIIEAAAQLEGRRLSPVELTEAMLQRIASVDKQIRAYITVKTNMHEFAWGGTTDNPHHGTCRNPWNLERFPAGSSGGSGAAVAARTCLGALGTDTGGSIRLPSSVNGIVGIRPTIGRVSN